jgi:hypothetical protein
MQNLRSQTELSYCDTTSQVHTLSVLKLTKVRYYINCLYQWHETLIKVQRNRQINACNINVCNLIKNKTSNFGGTNAREIFSFITIIMFMAKSSWILCFISPTHLLLLCGKNWYCLVIYGQTIKFANSLPYKCYIPHC